MGRTIAYCRVSLRDQNPQLQLDALHAHGYDQLFAEKQSGKHGTARPEFTRALAALQPGDTLVFWKSDRWGRSAAHVLTTVGELRGRGVTVKSLTVTGPAELAALRQLISDGTSVTQAARTLKISRSAAYAALRGPGSKL